jgi:pilus assembly protein CpaF
MEKAREASLQEWKDEMYEKVVARMDLSRESNDEELMELIHDLLKEESEKRYLPLELQAQIGKELFHVFRKLDILEELLENEEITEIMINGTQKIFIEEGGELRQLDKSFHSKEKLDDIIQQIVAESNRLVNETTPIVDTRLRDGSRVNIVLDPVALNGPIVTIRRFPKEPMTMKRLLDLGSISTEAAEFLHYMVASGYNIFVSGGTGSGKTSFLNALSDYIPKTERLITIEDNAELQIHGIENLVSLEARNPNVEGEGEISIRQLIRTALRMRPDRIIVGEVRGEEAIDMLQAMNTGHDGSLSTGHANSPKDMLERLETMVLMGMNLPSSSIQRQIAAGVDLIVHLGRMRDKSRKVLEITEIVGYRDQEILLQPLFVFEERGEKDGKVQGVLVRKGPLKRTEKLLAAGYTQTGIYTCNFEGEHCC